MTRLLLVEDEAAIAEPLADLLRAEGYEVTCAASAAAAEAAMADSPELVILDWMLPDRQGIDLVKAWRGRGSSMPVIFLTARDELIDKVVGLEMGADDYVTKPFEPRELLARIRVRLRRAGGEEPVETEQSSFAGVTIDMKRRVATFEANELELTRMELELLRLFVENPGRVFSREEILNKVWGFESYPSTRTVDTHVLQLRNKTRADLFETVRGVGYRFIGDEN